MLDQLHTRLLHLTKPRRFRAFCVGLPKAGTHSIARMFAAHRSAHEPGGEAFVATLMHFLEGRIDRVAMLALLRQRDRTFWLEMESAHFDVYVLDLLLELHPSARVILTVRDCYSWLDSFLNHEISRPVAKDSPWTAFRAYRFGVPFRTHAIEEALLATHGLATLDGYLSYWSAHITRVLQSVPAERLLILDVRRLAYASDTLAAFVGVHVSSLRTEHAHSFPAVRTYALLRQMDPEFVRAKAEQHCGELMRRFFPGHVTTLLRDG